MDIEQLLLTCVGFEDDGERIKLYVAGPTAEPPGRTQGAVRTPLFHLLAGAEAAAVREYLASHPASQVLKVNPTASVEDLKQPPQRRRRKRR